ncbi:MAG: hypothetical protein HY543_02695 [Deltaproteobacteria bacterium]|nr:hypothetical protein [Deltaproteobacteria bacterium]
MRTLALAAVRRGPVASTPAWKAAFVSFSAPRNAIATAVMKISPVNRTFSPSLIQTFSDIMATGERFSHREISLTGVHFAVMFLKNAERRLVCRVIDCGNRLCVDRSKTHAASFGHADPQMPD